MIIRESVKVLKILELVAKYKGAVLGYYMCVPGHSDILRPEASSY